MNSNLLQYKAEKGIVTSGSPFLIKISNGVEKMTKTNLTDDLSALKICKTEGCNSKHYSKELCRTHYDRFKRNGFTQLKPQEKRICSVEGCNKPFYGRTFCLRHCRMDGKYGNPLLDFASAKNDKTLWQKFNNRHKKLESGCWVWTGTILSHGYGQISINKRILSAHRFSFELHNGFTPQGFVLHSCDNPPCVNPAHLRQGSHQENMADKVRKNRQAKGETNGRCKLSRNDVFEIKKLISKGGVPLRGIAKQYGVSETTIGAIKRGKIWKHVF